MLEKRENTYSLVMIPGVMIRERLSKRREAVLFRHPAEIKGLV